MRVFLLGAGVSKTAMYPLTYELFEKVDQHVVQRLTDPPVHHHFDWNKEWPALKRFLQQNRNLLLVGPAMQNNIEYLLSAFDLYVGFQEELEHACLTGDSSAQALMKKKRKLLGRRLKQRDLLRQALTSLFEFRHWEDSKPDNSPKRETVRKLCRLFQEGDVVITFNYDALIERTLLEEGRWSPHDGYGVPVEVESPVWNPASAPAGSSQIKILKLHGSIGWRENPSSATLYLRNYFLSQMKSTLYSSYTYSGYDEDCLIAPSFIKRFESKLLTTLWREAAKTLVSAKRVIILGYGLPLADSATRSLLLATCSSKSAGQVHVVNPRQDAIQRFMSLLPEAIPHKYLIEEWLASSEVNAVVGKNAI